MKLTKRTAGLFCAAVVGVGPAAWGADPAATVVERVPADARTVLYPSNREPLKISPMVKLPIGAIKPGGWLLKQLQLEADGMAGHLPEVSPWCKFEGNAWTTKDRSGKNGWEEVPYWLKGFGDLGYTLGDRRIIAENQRWIDAIIAAQADDGWFGPDGLRTNDEAKHKYPDLWPHMPVLNALQSNYEYTAAQGKPDERVIKLMQRFFRWELNQPEEGFLIGYWAQTRTGDNLESVYWLYNRTGEKWLLDLAAKIDRHTPKWVQHNPFNRWHNVNLAQGFRYPTEFWQQSGDAAYGAGAETVYDRVMNAYGQVPGGRLLRRRERPPRLHRPPPRVRDLRHGRVHALGRDADQDHRRPRLGRPVRGRRPERLPGRHDARPQGAALPDQPQLDPTPTSGASTPTWATAAR